MSRCDNLKWSSLYVLGDDKVDSEHERLFELAQKIETYKGDIKGIQEAIKELVKYTKFHFANEERYMKSIEYKYLNNHKEIHRSIVKNLQEIVSSFNSTDIEEIYKKVMDFVKIGLIQHIMIEDKKVQHFRRNKLGLRNMFSWKDEYLLDNEEIDEDHKKLFMIAFKAFSHTKEENPRQYIKSVIIELNNYMKEHFDREESFMDSIEYSLLQEHKALHEKIITQINELIKKIPTMSIEEFEKELLASIDIWLVSHIINEDSKIICFINKQQGIDLDSIDVPYEFNDDDIEEIKI